MRIKYARIENDGLQRPCTREEHPGNCFLHKAGDFTCGRGRSKPAAWTPPAEVPDTEYPFTVSPGRQLYHYHTRTQTGRCEGLNDLLGEETGGISLQGASTMGIQPDEKIRVKSRRGKVIVKARLTPEVPPGMVWMAFHFRETCANWLTNAVFDPVSWTAKHKTSQCRSKSCETWGRPACHIGAGFTPALKQIQVA